MHHKLYNIKPRAYSVLAAFSQEKAWLIVPWHLSPTLEVTVSTSTSGVSSIDTILILF